jgi:uncharacterized protein (DUF433 family)
MGASKGAYPADRAAALSGVPKSTIHYWAREEILVPSISAEKVKLWSYPDLMGLRIIYWLRQRKEPAPGREVPRSSMPQVREVVAQLDELDLDLWTEDSGPSVGVDAAGKIIVSTHPTAEGPHRQRFLNTSDGLDVLEPFPTETGIRGPHLIIPRPKLRIVPGKLGGAPHVIHTRLESQAIGSLAASGLAKDKIYRLYPDFDPEGIDEAIELEAQLQRNLQPSAA